MPPYALPKTILRWTADGRRRLGCPDRGNVEVDNGKGNEKKNVALHGKPSSGGLQTDSSGVLLWKP